MTYKLNIRRITLGLLPIIALVFGGALAAVTSQASAPHNVKNIVLTSFDMTGQHSRQCLIDASRSAFTREVLTP
jgi:hypothetical protein